MYHCTALYCIVLYCIVQYFILYNRSLVNIAHINSSVRNFPVFFLWSGSAWLGLRIPKSRILVIFDGGDET